MLSEIAQTINWLLGLGLEARELSIGQTSLRAAVVFVLATAMIRVGHKRFMGKSTALDVMLGIVFGSVVSRAITGNAAFFPTLAAGFVLVLMHWVVTGIAFRHHTIGKIVKGGVEELVRDGEVQWHEMKRSGITVNDLLEAMRIKGDEPDIHKIKAAFLERDGDISVLMRK
jgi:uncharacterized membrane protein YcaP (DUF421 family)